MTSPTGLLYSQIGYEHGAIARAVIRGPYGTVTADTIYRVTDGDGCAVTSGRPEPFGQMWGSHWWIIDMGNARLPGKYRLSVTTGDVESWSGTFEVGEDILWKKTYQLVGIDQQERRAHLAPAKVGWQDCGTPLQELNSHASLIIGLTDMLEFRSVDFSAEERERLERQIVNGCAFLAYCQDLASTAGHGHGGFIHEPKHYANTVLPTDATKAAVALARSARFLSDAHAAEKLDYRRRASHALEWLAAAKPVGDVGFINLAHGVPEDFVAPAEWATRDLLMYAWAAFEAVMIDLGDNHAATAVRLVDEALQRQVEVPAAGSDLYGHFRSFSSASVTEKSWVHSLVRGSAGVDVGASFPHYLIPVIRMAQTWPDHVHSPRWRDALARFAFGYLLPVCAAGPFKILPLGEFDGQGLIWFAGSWHGLNAVYGLGAALALDLAGFFAEFPPPEWDKMSADRLVDIAMGNLQWIAGLNAGVTSDSLSGSVFYSDDIAEGLAAPRSMIYGIGQESAGSWCTLRGAICNGFSAGKQFEFDVAATADLDGPFSFTDEDWITHAGAWLSGTSRLRATAAHLSRQLPR